ncbi:MAG: hypothetical protein ACK4P5_03755, partial [Fimbriimonadales bacterium]
MFYPTIVLAIGDLACAALQETNALLQAFRSPALHMTALGARLEGEYLEISAPPIADSAPLATELMRWLYATRAEVNIDRARKQGMEVGPPTGYLIQHVLLVVDSDAYAKALEVVADLHALCERAQELVPARLHWLILHPSYDEPLPGEIVHEHQERLRNTSALQEGALVVTRLVRSDGSNMTPEQLRETIAYLLFASLHPAAFTGEHWLYRSVVDIAPAPSTLGCGLVVLPLHRMIRALQDKLVADALSAFLSGAKAPLQLPALEEQALWRTLVGKAAQVWTASKSARITVGEAFRLSAQLQIPAIAPRNPDPTQLDLIQEWETRWQTTELPHWRNLLEQFAHEELDAYLRNLRETIRQYLRMPNADLNTVATRLEQLAAAVSAWNAHHLTIERPMPNRKDSLRKQLEQAVKEPPPRQILGIRLRTRPQIARETLENFATALQAHYGQMIQVEAQEAFKSAAQRLLNELRQEQENYVAAQEWIQMEIHEHNERATNFRVEAIPWLKPLISSWQHLEPTAHALWGKRELASLVAQQLNPEQSLLQQLPRIEQHLQQQLQEWMTDYYRRFSYYLRERFPNHDA